LSSIDVVVPCYRYGRFLKECVESVLTQSISPVRILIIDDASPDNSAEIASDLAHSDPRINFIHHRQNKGHIATYNEGIEWVSSDYMLLLSADDYLLPGALGRAAKLMDENPDVSFTFGNALERNSLGSEKPIISVTRDRIASGYEFIKLSGPWNIVPTPTAVVRTQIQKRVGGYRPQLTHSGDMEMWLRLAAHGSVGMLKSYQAVYRRHEKNMSLNYSAEFRLPDLEQKRAALDSFFETCGELVANSQALQHEFRYLLAREAVGCASSAFNEQKMQSSAALTQFAFNTSPAIRRSLPWSKLFVKRMLGYRLWTPLSRSVPVSAQNPAQ
jgi:GT2 family glycosyltransferase